MRGTTRAAVLVAGLMAGLGASAASFGGHTMRLQEDAGPPLFTPTSSRGKGKGKRPSRSVGTRMYQRAALKKRNQARHRKACR